MSNPPDQRLTMPVMALLMSQVSVNLGAAFAKHLFPLIGPEGVTALRTSMAAGLLLALRRLLAMLVGLLLSAAPAVAPMAGWLVLREALTAFHWGAIDCIVTASAGSAATSHKNT